MTRKVTEKPENADQAIGIAHAHLREARDLLMQAGCPQATKAVRRAMKSVEGAQRHAARRPVAA
ncbi:MAG TPA: hypothetical protein P5256_00530 [Beijerinckiaceae bacterium]|jgi:hypothetical protein|nr:hypothetical protein [Rhodoblastus sp.]MCC2107947.1 hypothetical protein [Hyphomicrobiales bacterium]MCO5086039.1 hypothetical protein [Methylobacteriaceae bacterium]HRY01581.1 hypothetical protein [Beijerinckiaceae bacterium]